MTMEPEWRKFKRVPKSSFKSKADWTDYHNKKMRCAVCHNKIDDNQEFGLVPFKQDGFNAACVVMHKTCWAKSD